MKTLKKKINRINKRIKKYKKKQDRINDKIGKLKVKRYGLQASLDILEMSNRKGSSDE